MNLKDLDVTLEEAFEFGKLMGARDTLNELKDLAILDPNFLNYVKLKSKELEKTINFMKNYKINRRNH